MFRGVMLVLPCIVFLLTSIATLARAETACGTIPVRAAIVGAYPTRTGATMAGDGSYGDDDNTDPLAASFNLPTDVAVHPTTGDVYVADYIADAVRKIAAADGAVTTVAGNGVQANVAHATDATQGSIAQPQGLAIDTATDTLYISSRAHVLLRVPLSGATRPLDIVAGADGVSGSADHTNAPLSARFSQPQGLAFDADRRVLYVADNGNDAIRAYNVSSGAVTTLASGYPLKSPRKIARHALVDALFVTNAVDDEVRVVRVPLDPATGAFVAPMAKLTGLTSGGGGDGEFDDDDDDDDDDDIEYVGISVFANATTTTLVLADNDYDNSRIAGFAVSGTACTSLFSVGGQGYADGASPRFRAPGGIAADPVSGAVVIADYYNRRVRLLQGVAPACTPVTTAAPTTSTAAATTTTAIAATTTTTTAATTTTTAPAAATTHPPTTTTASVAPDVTTTTTTEAPVSMTSKPPTTTTTTTTTTTEESGTTTTATPIATTTVITTPVSGTTAVTPPPTTTTTIATTTQEAPVTATSEPPDTTATEIPAPTTATASAGATSTASTAAPSTTLASPATPTDVATPATTPRFSVLPTSTNLQALSAAPATTTAAAPSVRTTFTLRLSGDAWGTALAAAHDEVAAAVAADVAAAFHVPRTAVAVANLRVGSLIADATVEHSELPTGTNATAMVTSAAFAETGTVHAARGDHAAEPVVAVLGVRDVTSAPIVPSGGIDGAGIAAKKECGVGCQVLLAIVGAAIVGAVGAAVGYVTCRTADEAPAPDAKTLSDTAHDAFADEADKQRPRDSPRGSLDAGGGVFHTAATGSECSFVPKRFAEHCPPPPTGNASSTTDASLATLASQLPPVPPPLMKSKTPKRAKRSRRRHGAEVLQKINSDSEWSSEVESDASGRRSDDGSGGRGGRRVVINVEANDVVVLDDSAVLASDDGRSASPARPAMIEVDSAEASSSAGVASRRPSQDVNASPGDVMLFDLHSPRRSPRHGGDSASPDRSLNV